MVPILLILGLFGVMIFIFIGLNLSDTIENSTQYVLFWVVYTLVTMSVLNMFLLSYFWSVIRKKTGPIGIRGPKGDAGNRGSLGKCSMNSSNAICMLEITKMMNELFQKEEKDKIDNKRLDIDYKEDDDINETKKKIKSIITKDNLLINGFMRRKLATICKSIQFDVLNEVLVGEGKGPRYLIDYLKGIFKEWFYLIYNQNQKWFLDSDGTIRYDWKSDNPFNEIKKYDIYYWGDTRRFRPLINNICQSGIQENNTLPSSHNNSRLQILKTNDYKEVYNDLESGSTNALKVFRPNIHKYNDTEYHPLGDVAVAGNLKDRKKLGIKENSMTRIGDLEYDKSSETNNGPDKETILITGDVADPVGYELMWRDQKDSTSWMNSLRKGASALTSTSFDDNSYGPGRLWKPIAPQGYTCLGDVATQYYPPDHPNRSQYLKYNKDVNIKCLPSDCVEPVDEQEIINNERLIWNVNRDNNSDVVFNGSVYTLGENEEATSGNNYNLFRTSDFSYIDRKGNTISKKGDTYYKIKKSCLSGSRQKTKEVETQFENIGIGWYGTPANSDPKYSIFHFMGLVPEGVIENSYTYNKYYIVHYGGVELNCYNIHTFNDATSKYDKAYEIDPDNGDVYSRKIKKNYKKQQWRIKKQDDKYYLESVYNQRILAANIESNNPPLITIKSTAVQNKNIYLFSFTPAFGSKPTE